MARKKSPASLERKKLQKKRERASALSKQSSVKADKRQAWWCQKKKGPTYSSLPSNQRKRQEWEDQKIDTAQKPEYSFLALILGCALSLYLFVFVYQNQLHHWFLVGPDTLYLRYGFSSTIAAFLVCMLEIGSFSIALNILFFALRDWFQSKIEFRPFISQLKGGLLLIAAGLALFWGPVLLSCLSRTEATSTGVSTYVLGIRTSWHPFEELEEAEYYRKDYRAGRGAGRTYPTYNYALRFQDGYEIDLTHLYAYCIGRNQLENLSKLVSPALQD